MKNKTENKAIEMDRNSQGTDVTSNVAHTLKPGEQEFSFPHDHLTVVAKDAREAEEKRAAILRSRKAPENKARSESEDSINNK
jgi:hypothetical protein